jgi:predicted Rossmann fold nucleotide-binding protein DprA/Smf involved in DNA uptake
MKQENSSNSPQLTAAVIGSRGIEWFDFDTLAATVPQFHDITHVVSGGANGIDTLAQRYFENKGVPVEVLRPDYKLYGSKAAPHVRNRAIIDKSDIVIAVWDMVSKGTAGALSYARSRGKKIYIIQWQIQPPKNTGELF